MTNIHTATRLVRVICFSCLAALTTCAKAELIVGITDDAPPISYIDKDGNLGGFGVDIAALICAQLKESCTLKPLRASQILSSTSSGEVDFSINGCIPSQPHKSKVLFTKSLYRSQTFLLTKKGRGMIDPKLSVAVINGTNQHTFALTRDWFVMPTVNQSEMIDAMASGRVNGVLLPMLNALSFIESERISRLKLESVILSDSTLNGTTHIPVNPAQPNLVNRINNALDAIKASGLFDKAAAKHLPFRL